MLANYRGLLAWHHTCKLLDAEFTPNIYNKPASQWDVLTDSEACAVVRRHLQQAGAPRQITPPQLLPGAAAFGAGSFASQLRRPPQLTPALAAAAAERLVQESLDRGTMDNVTAVVGLLQVGWRGLLQMGWRGLTMLLRCGAGVAAAA